MVWLVLVMDGCRQPVLCAWPVKAGRYTMGSSALVCC